MGRLLQFLMVSMIAALVFSTGCTRDMKKDSSVVRLVMPSGSQQKGLSGQSVDMTKTCFAVNIYGPDLGSGPNSCGLSVGTWSPMVKGDGAVIELNVPKGSSRTVELYRYEMANADGTCPTTFNPNNCEETVMCSTYKSGEASNINMEDDEVSVQITLDTSSTAGLSSSCSDGSIKAMLMAGGDVTDASGTLLTTANGPYASVSMNGSSVETWNPSGESSGGESAPAFVRSITRKPDTGQLYGLSGQNEIVALDGSGGHTSLGSCPFASCTLPVWIQSISAGYGQNLFAIDASGGVYKIEVSGLTQISTVNPAVVQVVVH